MKKELTTNYWKQQYLFNTFVHNSPIDSNGYCQEENKLINYLDITNMVLRKII